MNDEFSLMDCAVAPIMWRLDAYGIASNTLAKPLRDYAKRVFELDAFKSSMSESERELRS
jgi:RNA polymerase-associated protein